MRQIKETGAGEPVTGNTFLLGSIVYGLNSARRRRRLASWSRCLVPIDSGVTRSLDLTREVSSTKAVHLMLMASSRCRACLDACEFSLTSSENKARSAPVTSRSFYKRQSKGFHYANCRKDMYVLIFRCPLSFIYRGWNGIPFFFVVSEHLLVPAFFFVRFGQGCENLIAKTNEDNFRSS
jgi:hypothetical protein